MTLLSLLQVLKDQGEVANRIGIMVASHNEDTVRFALKKMDEIGISPEDKVICFGQLLGMCDYITMPLGNQQLYILNIVKWIVLGNCFTYTVGSHSALINSLFQVNLDTQPTNTYHMVLSMRYYRIYHDVLLKIKVSYKKLKKKNVFYALKYYDVCSVVNGSTNRKENIFPFKWQILYRLEDMWLVKSCDNTRFLSTTSSYKKAFRFVCEPLVN